MSPSRNPVTSPVAPLKLNCNIAKYGVFAEIGAVTEVKAHGVVAPPLSSFSFHPDMYSNPPSI